MESSRIIIAFDHVTADGYFAAPDGSLSWVVPDDEIDRAAATNIPNADTIIFGRRTYDLFEAYWPKALDEKAADPHDRSRTSPAIRAMARWINDAKKVVFSKSRRKMTWNNSWLIRDLDAGEIRAMKEQPGKDIMIFGSGSIVSQLTQYGLIDQYHFVVCPVLLGGGRPLLSGINGPPPLLELQEATKYPSGNVVLRYVRRMA